jgi:peptidoglycan-associated lipoprotein
MFFTRTQTLALILTATSLGLGLTACRDVEYPTCKKDKQCNADLGEVCVDGTCQGCESDSDCTAYGDGLVCYEFRCQDPAELANVDPPTPGDEGSPCTARTDCFGGLACITGTCQPCSEDLECAPYGCNVSTGRCDPQGACEVDNDCPQSEICDGGMCVYTGDPSGGGGDVCGLDTVYFAFDSSALTPATRGSLEQAAMCIADSGRSVVLEAHADNVGTEEYNILLTERRGQSVADLLESAGVPPGLLSVLAKGSLEATGQSESDRARDRRVDLFFE